MSQYNKERHAAAMLIHQLGSGIEALEDLSPELIKENAADLYESHRKLGGVISKILQETR